MFFLKYYPPNFLRQGLLSLCPGTHQAGLGGRVPGTGRVTASQHWVCEYTLPMPPYLAFLLFFLSFFTLVLGTEPGPVVYTSLANGGCYIISVLPDRSTNYFARRGNP